MLEVAELETGYGKRQVLFGPSVKVCAGDVVALIGPNGAGKSTLLKAVCGLLPVWRGQIRFDGSIINGATPSETSRRGIVFLPQGNRTFDGLSVIENLEVGQLSFARADARERIAAVLDFFPVLKDRLREDAGRLSGGEQQMLALARALVPKPRLIMLDEPSLGLSPMLARQVFDQLASISHTAGVAILIVEQKVQEVLNICNQVYSMKFGKIAFEGLPGSLKSDVTKLRQLFL